MKTNISYLLVILAFASLCIILPFYLVQQKIQLPKVLANGYTNNSQSFPERLKIPAINVSALIEGVGTKPDGVMGLPNNIKDVGWFSLGPRPGEPGSAVMAGHFDGPDNKSGVFMDLYKLKMGDKLFVEFNTGKTDTFTVRDIRTYDPGYAEEVFSSSSGTHLNLVTCDGVWNGVQKSYSKRLVVFADIST